ncbi:MAG: acyltransferase [Burkholderiaceae bacterium]|nr:acyltransferase [Burkholderiaceae bacterium]
MRTERRHWAAINESSFVAGMRFLFWVCRVFGRWPFRVVLYPVLFWYLLIKPSARRASQAYLRRVAKHVTVDTGWFGVLRHFAAFAETILDKMLLWGGMFKTDSVRYFGIDMMHQCIRDKRGVMLICSHLGNLDLCRVLSSMRNDFPLTILVHTKHAQAFNNMLAALNPASSLNLMQVTEVDAAAAMQLAERMERGESVVIAGDRIPVSSDPRVAFADFLGEKAAFPVGPYVLAGALQCPVYLLFSLRHGEDYEVHFELLRESARLPRKNREEALDGMAADFAARLQYHCLRAPLQWFNFYDFWHFSRLERSDASR